MRTLLSLLLVVGLANAAYAAPGDPDSTFSSDGMFLFTVGGNGGANAVALQTDGKIVVAGFLNAQQPGAVAGAFAVARLLPNGTPDPTFGEAGIVTTSFAGGASAATAIAIQPAIPPDPDPRIVVAGFAGAFVSIARYRLNGTLDPAFGIGGRVEMLFGSSPTFGANGMALEPDDGQIKIVVVGQVGGAGGSDFAIARFTANGTLDDTFNVAGPTRGIVQKNMGGSDVARAVAILPNGDIVVAGSKNDDSSCGPTCFAVAQFTSAGIDRGLGNNAAGGSGAVLGTPFAIALQPNGMIVVAGTRTFGTTAQDMVIGRFGSKDNGDGTLDPAFDGGFVTIRFDAVNDAKAIALQPDGKIVVAGSSLVPGQPNADFALARLHSFGELDLTFNGVGKLITDFSGGGTTRNDFASAIAIQPNDGRIVVAGFSRIVNSNNRFAVARYHAFVCADRNVTILGTNASETLLGRIERGNDLADVIHGLGGNDTIDGRGNNDVICGGEGDDTLSGGSGDDALFAGDGRDLLDGGPGNDTCVVVELRSPGDRVVECERGGTGASGFSGEWLEAGQKCTRSKHHPSCRLRGSLRVFNPGTEATPVRSQVALYLSEDEQLDGNDVFLTTKRVGRLAAGGGERVIELNVRLRGVDDLTSQFVIAVLDYLDTVPEVNEDNNVVVSPPLLKERIASRRGKDR